MSSFLHIQPLISRYLQWKNDRFAFFHHFSSNLQDKIIYKYWPATVLCVGITYIIIPFKNTEVLQIMFFAILKIIDLLITTIIIIAFFRSKIYNHIINSKYMFQ